MYLLKLNTNWWWWSGGEGIQKKYNIELTQIQTLRIMMMMKRRKVNPTNLSITINHKWKICGGWWWWLGGGGIPTERYNFTQIFTLWNMTSHISWIWWLKLCHALRILNVFACLGPFHNLRPSISCAHHLWN